METKTKLLLGFLILLGIFATLSVSVLADPLGPPFRFYKGPVLSGLNFEVDGQTFMQNEGQIYYLLDGQWYLMLPNTYQLEQAPYPLTVHMLSDVYCHYNSIMGQQVCESSGSGSGSGGGCGGG